ncbi:choice-of-anchor D domain-containing protein [Flavobacteriaceae bacterium LMO-SS05]
MIIRQSLIVFVSLCASSIGFGQISITGLGAGNTYTQDFNSLAIGGSSTLVPIGWSFSESGTNANTTYSAGAGNSIAGDTYSFGIASNTERSFGGLQSGTLTPTIGVSFTNDTGTIITELTISYTGEQWRLGATGRVDQLDFQYSLNATSLTTGTWTDENNLDFTAPITAGTVGALDGNLVNNRTSKAFTITGLSIANGATFWLRWNDLNASGADDGLAVDDFSIYVGSTPSPELQLVDNTTTYQNCGYTINFGSQALSTQTDLTFDIKNLGSLDLIISSFDITGDYTVLSPISPFTITSGNSQTITVRYTPTIDGTRSGTLTINNNDSNEGSCVVNLTGVGYTPAPEIDVEKNTNASIPNGSVASIGFNTVFATTTIGSSTSPKTFYVHNEGTANLIVSSIVSSNPTEFSVSPNPATIVLAPGELAVFEITFMPNSASPPLRTATITLANNDSDEGSYTFKVQGNANCAAGSLSISPQSGPVGTVITIVGTNFGGLTTALLNSTPAVVNVISSTTIEVTVPANSTTGSLEISNDIGCKGSAFFVVIDNYISGCEGSGTFPSDLFISEVTDKGTGSHSYIEIFNGTGAPIDLTAGNYQIRIHNNGNATPTGTINLTGTIGNNSVVVVAIGGTNATDPEGGYIAQFFSATSGINDDDHIRLYKNTAWIDLWGDTTGTAFTVASKDYTYRRKKSGITAPSTAWNATDWKAFTPVSYSDIGLFDFSIGTPPSVASGPILASSCYTATINVTGAEGTDPAGLAYQWFYLAPGNPGWTMATNGSIYKDVTAATLDILNTSSLEGYQFYCQIREDDPSCYTASQAIRLTLPITTWTSSGWTKGSPNLDTIAIMNWNYNTGIDGNFRACNLTVNNDGMGGYYTLIIADNTYVEVENNLIVNGKLIVTPKGSFVQNNDGTTVTVVDKTSITVEKETAPMYNWYEYTYWSSPVTGETIDRALADASPNRRFLFNAKNYRDSFYEVNNDNTATLGQDDIDDDANVWSLVPGSDVMVPGVGYASTHRATVFIGPGSPPYQFKYVFQGPFNDGIIEVPIYRNDAELDDNNWNFIGNPYPSAISTKKFFEENVTKNPKIGGAIYLWSQNTAPSSLANGNEQLNFSSSDYAIINETTAISGGDGVNGVSPIIGPGPDFDSYIPSGQGFFVTMSNTSPSSLYSGQIDSTHVRFNNGMRAKESAANSQFFRTSNPYQDNTLWLNLTSDNGVFSQIAIGYVKKATDGYDGEHFDAPRNKSTNSTILYSIIKGCSKKFAIQGKSNQSLCDEEVIQLGFDTTINVPTLYKISKVKIQGDFLKEHTIYLKDKFLQLIHDLDTSDYAFTSEVGEFKDRFELVFQSETLSDLEAQINSNNLSIMELKDGRIQINSNSNLRINSVKIMDILGKSLYQLKGTSPSEIYTLTNLSQSTFIALIELSNGQVVTKRTVKRR